MAFTATHICFQILPCQQSNSTSSSSASSLATFTSSSSSSSPGSPRHSHVEHRSANPRPDVGVENQGELLLLRLLGWRILCLNWVQVLVLCNCNHPYHHLKPHRRNLMQLSAKWYVKQSAKCSWGQISLTFPSRPKGPR